MELKELTNNLWSKYKDGYFEEVFKETRKWFSGKSRLSYDNFIWLIAISNVSNQKISGRIFWRHLIYETRYDILGDKIYKSIRKDFIQRWDELIYEGHSDVKSFWSVFYKELRWKKSYPKQEKIWMHIKTHEWQNYIDFIGNIEKARMNEYYGHLKYYTEDYEQDERFINGSITYKSGSPFFVKECLFFHIRNALTKTINEFIGEGRIEEIRGKWVNEFKLYLRIKDYFKEFEVIHQGSPYFLEGQRFDVWIPELKVAVEYNGIQHYEAVDIFGGEEGLKSTINRDKLKRQKCLNNAVKIIEVDEGYDFNILVKNIHDNKKE